MTSSIKAAIHDEMKSAMKAKDKPRLAVFRLIQSEFKRIEVDERIDLDDTRVLEILDKMLKQRRDSFNQYTKAGRSDLADQEQYEISVITEYLPDPLNEDEINALIKDAISSLDAQSMQAMGKVMAELKPKLQGRADLAKVSSQVRAQLTA